MPLTIWNCVMSYKQNNFFSDISLLFQKITSITVFPSSNFLLPTFLTGGKWAFYVANVLLATVNFKPSPRHSSNEGSNIVVILIRTVSLRRFL